MTTEMSGGGGMVDPGSAVCPGCRSGAHYKCDEGAWDEVTDEPTVCACYARNHEE